MQLRELRFRPRVVEAQQGLSRIHDLSFMSEQHLEDAAFEMADGQLSARGSVVREGSQNDFVISTCAERIDKADVPTHHHSSKLGLVHNWAFTHDVVEIPLHKSLGVAFDR